jgi:uncharacterized membrane protein YdcZ (DUF606 family)
MSTDPEGVEDSPRHSVLAVLAAVAALIGLLSIVAPTFSVLSGGAAILGLLVLAFSSRWELSSASKRIAKFAFLVGLFGLAAGITAITRQRSLHDRQAILVATQYVEALVAGNRGEAIRLTGLPPAVEDPTMTENQMSREQLAVRKMLNDPVIVSIIENGSNSKFRPTGIKSRFRNGATIDYEVGFVDESYANPKPYVVSLKLTNAYKYESDRRRQWYVDRIMNELR